MLNFLTVDNYNELKSHREKSQQHFTVFLPPSSREIQFNIHVYLIRHNKDAVGVVASQSQDFGSKISKSRKDI